MRKIVTKDVCKLARILRKGNFEANIAKAVEEMEGAKGKKISEKAGIKIMLVLFESVGDPEVEKLVYELFGDIAEIDPQEIANMPIEDTIKLIKQINEQNDLRAFFRAAGRLV